MKKVFRVTLCFTLIVLSLFTYSVSCFAYSGSSRSTIDTAINNVPITNHYGYKYTKTSGLFTKTTTTTYYIPYSQFIKESLRLNYSQKTSKAILLTSRVMLWGKQYTKKQMLNYLGDIVSGNITSVFNVNITDYYPVIGTYQDISSYYDFLSGFKEFPKNDEFYVIIEKTQKKSKTTIKITGYYVPGSTSLLSLISIGLDLLRMEKGAPNVSRNELDSLIDNMG